MDLDQLLSDLKEQQKKETQKPQICCNFTQIFQESPVKSQETQISSQKSSKNKNYKEMFSKPQKTLEIKLLANLKFKVLSDCTSKLKTIQQLIVHHGGVLDQQADVIICDSNKSIENENKTLIYVDWLYDTVKLNKIQPYSDYDYQEYITQQDIYYHTDNNNCSKIGTNTASSYLSLYPEDLIYQYKNNIEFANEEDQNSDIEQNNQNLDINDYWDNQKHKFACQQSVFNELNQNKVITDQLEDLLKVYFNLKDEYRIIAYQKAISTLKNLKFQIKSVAQLDNLHGIGDAIKKKIIEILEKGYINRARFMKGQIMYQTIQEFQKVWGIGIEMAKKLYSIGLRTIDDLNNNKDLLNKNQLIGLECFKDFQTKIPRVEAEEIGKIVLNSIKQIQHSNDNYTLEICGSFRRGNQFSSDIDILITNLAKDSVDHSFLARLVQKLMEQKYITYNLQMPSIKNSYMGVFKLNQFNRRIDLKCYPQRQFPFALLHFTGSDHFNRSIRLFAKKKGYSLTDEGLYKVDRINKQKVWISEGIWLKDEKSIFDFLGLNYKCPQERNI